MDPNKLLTPVINFLCILILLPACGTPQPTPTPPPTVTLIPTYTLEPTVTPEPPTPTLTSTPDIPVWDYVAFGSSVVSLWGDYSYTVPYAQYIEADLGIKVSIHNKGIPGSTIVELLDGIRSKPAWRDALGDAEVVTVYIGGNDLDFQLMGEYKSGKCGGEDNMDCMRNFYLEINDNFDALFEEILSLCSPSTIIRASTLYYGSLKVFDFNEDLAPFYRLTNEQILLSAAEHNIPVARVDIAFNGSGGDESSIEKGYVEADTPGSMVGGLHPTHQGSYVIADAHRELGYEPSIK